MAKEKIKPELVYFLLAGGLVWLLVGVVYEGFKIGISLSSFSGLFLLFIIFLGYKVIVDFILKRIGRKTR